MIDHRFWIQTYSGVAFDLMNPTPEMIRAEDIAHHLSMLCRFGGASRRFYSVAEHCLLVANHLPPEVQLEGLLHDAAWAYVGDMVSPLRRLMRSIHQKGYDYAAGVPSDPYEEIYQGVESAVAQRFGVSFRHPLIVQEDLRALATEKRNLLGPEPQDWGIDWARYPPYEDAQHSDPTHLGAPAILKVVYAARLETLLREARVGGWRG